jgi:hypothetical protein
VRLETSAVPVFARHESFHPRYGWLKRAVDAAAEDPGVFAREDAVVTLGVGKNMVRAIRHWGLATKVLAVAPNPARPRMPLIKPSSFGLALLGDNGLDPYSEDPATLWALHWRMLSPRSSAPVWWLALNEFPGLAFTHAELEEFILDYLSRLQGWETPHRGSVKKDVACFLRMYTAALGGARATTDEGVDCPFRHIGLVRTEGRSFRFDLGNKPGLAPNVVLYTCLDYMARVDPGARSATVNRLATEIGGPGRAFKLTEESMTEILSRANKGTAHVDEVAGVPQLRWSQDPSKLARQALWNHYVRRSKAAPPELCLGGPMSDVPVEVSEWTAA